MAKNLELLLTENVEGTGIVGDVVKVRKGFARNFLLPRGYATKPSDEMIKSLAGKRAEAQKQLAELRRSREELIKKLQGFGLTMVRSCNDMGILYAAVTQHDIATALGAAGFAGIKDREVRLGQTIKRVDHYDVHVKLDSDLDATVKLDVQSDRPLDLKKSSELSAAPEGDAAAAAGGEGGEAAIPSEKRSKDRSAKGDKKGEAAAPAQAESKPGTWAPRADKGADKGAEKPAAKAEKGEKAEKKSSKK